MIFSTYLLIPFVFLHYQKSKTFYSRGTLGQWCLQVSIYMLFGVGFHENMELRQRFDDRVDYKILNNCSSLDLEAHVKRRNRAKHEKFSVLD